jgi:glucuronate isomerase
VQRDLLSGALARELYGAVADLPILSPHGHVDIGIFGEGRRLDPPGRLFVTGDHYVLRLLYSQGVALERLGVRPLDGGPYEDDDRAVWRLLAERLPLFAGTPTGLWLRNTLADVFGIAGQLRPDSADAIYDAVEEQLASRAFAPRALLDRFRIDFLATTDPAGATLAEHAALGLGGRVRPTFRPDAVVALDGPGWRKALDGLEGVARREVGAYDAYVVALRERRAAFKALGATATDHSTTSADTTPLAPAAAAAIFDDALAGAVTGEQARRFEAHMLHEFARMSLDDGLVMQLHVGSLRDHNTRLAARFGRDLGGDIPVATDWTRGLQPLLELAGNEPGFGLVLYTLDESTYSRELAPLAGHYPAVSLGSPWWFHDSAAGIDRYLDRVVETAGIFNLAGFVDDARSLVAIPVRHDFWRRNVCTWLARKVEAGLVAADDAVPLATALAHGLAARTYRV